MRIFLPVLLLGALSIASCSKKKKETPTKPLDDRAMCEKSLKKTYKCMPAIAKQNKKPMKDKIEQCVKMVKKHRETNPEFYKAIMGCLKLDDCKAYRNCMLKNSRKRSRKAPRAKK